MMACSRGAAMPTFSREQKTAIKALRRILSFAKEACDLCDGAFEVFTALSSSTTILRSVTHVKA